MAWQGECARRVTLSRVGQGRLAARGSRSGPTQAAILSLRRALSPDVFEEWGEQSRGRPASARGTREARPEGRPDSLAQRIRRKTAGCSAERPTAEGALRGPLWSKTDGSSKEIRPPSARCGSVSWRSPGIDCPGTASGPSSNCSSIIGPRSTRKGRWPLRRSPRRPRPRPQSWPH